MRKLRPIPHSHPERGGTTLTEVLMAILCMGIGVVAVASLFPIALLRSVQATQLTNGTILRFNAETFVDLNPSLIVDPDGDGNLGEHTINPQFANKAQKQGKFYLIDPLGWNIVNSDANTASADFIGNMPRFGLNYAPYNLGTEQAAANFVSLPDSWTTMHEEIPVSNTATAITLNTIPADVTNALSSNLTVRLVMFGKDENVSETRFINSAAISGNTITWPNTAALPGPPLPNNNQYYPAPNNQVAKVRIEVRERRYTWLLTVRNFTSDPAVPQALVDVAIFFNRSPGIEDETPYILTYVKPRTYQVGVAGDKPFLKKGGYMLDTSTGAWHRVQKVDETTDPYTITLEKNTTAGIGGDSVVFMRGVIDVYPLGTKP